MSTLQFVILILFMGVLNAIAWYVVWRSQEALRLTHREFLRGSEDDVLQRMKQMIDFLNQTIEELRSERGRFLNQTIEELRSERGRFDRYGWEGRRYPSREVDRYIDRIEDRFGVRLTPGAREMIVIPVEEATRLTGPVNGELEESVTRIIEEVAENPDRRDADRRVRSSLSVIRAYWTRFCNIPPFCDRTDAS